MQLTTTRWYRSALERAQQAPQSPPSSGQGGPALRPSDPARHSAKPGRDVERTRVHWPSRRTGGHGAEAAKPRLLE
eukprot:111959-Pyramimonas_sp.AAC.1